MGRVNTAFFNLENFLHDPFCHRDVLQKPLLYLSHYFKLHRAEYYDRLMAIRNEGNWESCLSPVPKKPNRFGFF